eukprot:g26249.t1
MTEHGLLNSEELRGGGEDKGNSIMVLGGNGRDESRSAGNNLDMKKGAENSQAILVQDEDAQRSDTYGEEQMFRAKKLEIAKTKEDIGRVMNMGGKKLDKERKQKSRQSGQSY